MNFQLNENQLKIVNNIDGSFIILAPAGCGKTQTMSLRIDNMIKKGIDSSKILCLTFTNRASREMINKIKNENSQSINKITIKTFHGFCYQICREEYKKIGISNDFTIYDEEDTKEILKDIFKTLNITSSDFILNQIYIFLQKTKEELSFNDTFDIDNYFNKVMNSIQFDTPIKNLTGTQIFNDYNNILKQNQAMDFTDLSTTVQSLFNDNYILSKWTKRFNYIMVDEVQDTNLIEYTIISKLASKHKNIALFGDFDQTIYEWRGSNPDLILSQFKTEFSPVMQIHLKENYRSTQNILNASRDFIKQYENSQTKELIPISKEMGDLIFVHAEENLNRESVWICKEIEKLVKEGKFKLKDIAVLTRNNKLNVEISKIFQRMNIPSLLVDEYKFFRRKEIKDAISYIRFIINSFDYKSFNRVINSVPNKISNSKIEEIRRRISGAGLNISDFLESNQSLDPYEDLLTYYENNSLVVFDVESTGLDVLNDEVIEIAAIKFGKSGIVSDFHFLLQNNRSLGDSTKIHGYTQSHIDSNGQNPILIFNEFKKYIKDCIIIGHNVQYDISIIESQSNRLGIKNYSLPKFYDTLDISRRFYKNLQSYKLEYLAEYLNLNHKPTHKAMDDILTTMFLLEKTLKKIYDLKFERISLYSEYYKKFYDLKNKTTSWKKQLNILRPHELLVNILKESSMLEYYKSKNEENRINNLRELYLIFKSLDNPNLSPKESTLQILSNISLGNDMERYIDIYNKVPIITIHQAKGLEFEAVFMPSLNEGDFPSFMSIRQNSYFEEHRLFYVAMTRAKSKLYLSYNFRDHNDKLKKESRFLNCISSKYKKYI